jgi:nucleotide-binding universal stress UspA family protein
MGKRVVVATDFSEAADEAVRQADQRARSAGATLTVFHVILNPLRTDPLFPQFGQEIADATPTLQRDAVERVNGRVTALTGRRAGEFEVVVEDGAPHAVIVRGAEERKADLLVVGAHGATGLSRTLLGSVAERVVRHAHCPVLVARHSPKSRTVLVATDFSDPSLPAVAAAGEEARRSGAKLTIFHSIDLGLSLAAEMPEPLTTAPFGFSSGAREELRDAVDRKLASALARYGIDGDRVVAFGPAAQAILRYADQLQAGLIVVGTVGRTGLPRLLLGSVAEKVVRTAACSVLVVRLSAA